MFSSVDTKTATIAGVGLAIGAILASIYVFNSTSLTEKEVKSKKKTNSKSKSVSGSGSVGSKVTNDIVKEDTECLKGYKTTSDGRKTSYFNRELSERDKQLLGDCRPQKIDPTAGGGGVDTGPRRLTPSPGPSSGSNSPSPLQHQQTSASGWNTAGTWEEKTSTAWAHARLTELLEGCQHSTHSTVDGARYTVTLTLVRVSSIDGEVYVAFTRGKKLYLYDLKVKLSYELEVKAELGSGSGSETFAGTLSVTDISPDDDHFEYELLPASSATGTATKVKPEHARQLQQQFLRGKLHIPLKGVVESKKSGSFHPFECSNLHQEFINCFAEFLCLFHQQ